MSPDPRATGRRLLVTGASGFAGRHLVAAARARGTFAAVIGAGRRAAGVMGEDYLSADLLDPAAAERLVRTAAPTDVAHLAAEIGPDPAIERRNVSAFGNLAAALRRWAPAPVTLLTVGSAAELGPAGVRTLPATEEAPCEPLSPYGRGKLAVTRAALAEPTAGPLRCVVARTFNLCGPGLPATLALGRFAAQVAAAGRGETDVIRCGPLETRRDVLDVRDAAAAYLDLLDAAPAGTLWNVCRGESHAMGALLDELIRLGGATVRVEPGERRSGDLADVYGDRSRLTGLTGWAPRVSVEDSLRDLLSSVAAASSRRPAAQRSETGAADRVGGRRLEAAATERSPA